MKDLISRSYEAIKARGLINNETSKQEFMDKLEEELDEVKYCSERIISGWLYESEYVSELTDLATVCIMQIHHLGYDFIEEFTKVIEKNEKRAKETR